MSDGATPLAALERQRLVRQTGPNWKEVIRRDGTRNGGIGSDPVSRPWHRRVVRAGSCRLGCRYRDGGIAAQGDNLPHHLDRESEQMNQRECNND